MEKTDPTWRADILPPSPELPAEGFDPATSDAGPTDTTAGLKEGVPPAPDVGPLDADRTRLGIPPGVGST